MNKNVELVKKYFQLSNDSNLDEIKNFFLINSTYSSENTGLYLGVNEIMKMQKDFHKKFDNLKWNILKIEEVKPNIINVFFQFLGKLKTKENIELLGIENVIIFENKIQHIEIKKT